MSLRWCFSTSGRHTSMACGPDATRLIPWPTLVIPADDEMGVPAGVVAGVRAAFQ